MALSFGHLRILTAVGEAQSISHAARSLGISQPAVSKSLRALEGVCGVQLVISTAGGSQLTEAGEALFVHAQAILSATSMAEEEIAAFRNVRRGVLRIGASTTIARYYLPPAIAEFHRRHPDVEVRVTVQHSRFVARLLIDRELDVALVEAPVTQPQLTTIRWHDDELIPVAAPTHALVTRRPTVAALESGTWLLREPWSGARDFSLAALRECGVTARHILTADCNEVIVRLAIDGAGVAIVPRAVAANHLLEGTLSEVTIPGWKLIRPLNRLGVAGRRPGQIARAFEVLLDTSAPLARTD